MDKIIGSKTLHRRVLNRFKRVVKEVVKESYEDIKDQVPETELRDLEEEILHKVASARTLYRLIEILEDLGYGPYEILDLLVDEVLQDYLGLD